MDNYIVGIEDGQILEGFLCPICRNDLKTPERLTEHVEKFHEEEQDVLRSLKEIFSKAKRKIKLNFDDTLDLAKSIETVKISNQKSDWNIFNFMKTQNIGTDFNHFSYFNSIRAPRIDRYANETNRLLIRLNKLLKDMPNDPIQRKLHQKNTVPWLDGKLVKLCPVCAKSFHLARRQHHCRLCGSIMCHSCSQFLPYDKAISLIETTNSQGLKNYSLLTDNLENIRTCDHCLRLLETRQEMQDSRTCQPPITKIYFEIQGLKNDVHPDIEMYCKMVKSLYEGESIYTIQNADALRGKIGKIFQLIDNKSKEILNLSCPEASREEALKKSLRCAATQFIKDNMNNIPPLPLQDEIMKLQETKKMEMQQKIEYERRLALEAYEKYGLVPETNSSPEKSTSFASGSAIAALDNWSGYNNQITLINSERDPLLEQINIIKGYIKQAKQAMRFDEIETLEMNLKDLQNELYNRQLSNN